MLRAAPLTASADGAYDATCVLTGKDRQAAGQGRPAAWRVPRKTPFHSIPVRVPPGAGDAARLCTSRKDPFRPFFFAGGRIRERLGRKNRPDPVAGASGASAAGTAVVEGEEPKLEQFDYIIVGAGSAGCPVARALSEDPRSGFFFWTPDPMPIASGSTRRLAWPSSISTSS